MKISTFDKRISRQYATSSKKIDTAKDFSNTLNMENKEQQKFHIEKMVKKIKEAGEKVKETQNIVNIKIYKEYIAEFLSFVLNNCYSTSHVHGYQGLLIKVDVINKKLEKLTLEVIEQEKDNLAIAKEIDEITGLLLDLYT